MASQVNSKEQDFIKDRNTCIGEKTSVLVNKFINCDTVINKMLEKAMIKDPGDLNTYDENTKEKKEYFWISIVPKLDAPQFEQLKTFIKECGDPKNLCKELPGDCAALPTDEKDFYRNCGDYSLNEQKCDEIWKKQSTTVCQIYSDEDHQFLATGFIVGPGVPDPVTKTNHRYILTCYNVLHDSHTSSANSSNSAVFGHKHLNNTSANLTVRVQRTIYATDERLNYVLLALEPSEQLESYIMWEWQNSITSQKPSPGDFLMVLGHPKDKPLKLFTSMVPSKIQETKCKLDYVGFGKCDVIGGVLMAKDRNMLFAMTTGVNKDKEDNTDNLTVYSHKATYIWDIIADIDAKIKTNEKNCKIQQEIFQKLFPNFTTQD